MKSMTGFGLGKTQSPQSVIEVSLRAVNGRYFEPRFHLPREFIQIEPELKKILQKFFDRGTIDVFVSRRLKPGVSTAEVVVNKPLLKKYASAYKAISNELKIPVHLTVENLAKWPDVIKLEDRAELSGGEKKFLIAAMNKAVESADKERRREGKDLRKQLEQLLQDLDAQVEAVQAVREETNKNLLARFEQRIKAKLPAVEFDSARLSQEVVLQIDKSDINEELSRLKEHIRNYHQLLSSQEPVGKKLDFYTQELLREVNTIGSKSSVSQLTQIVVHAKTLIERLREQVQNVE